MFNFTNPKYEGFDKFSVIEPQYKLKLLINKYSKTSFNGDSQYYYLHFDLIYSDSLYFSCTENLASEYLLGKRFLELILNPELPKELYDEVIGYLSKEKIFQEDLTLIL